MLFVGGGRVDRVQQVTVRIGGGLQRGVDGSHHLFGPRLAVGMHESHLGFRERDSRRAGEHDHRQGGVAFLVERFGGTARPNADLVGAIVIDTKEGGVQCCPDLEESGVLALRLRKACGLLHVAVLVRLCENARAFEEGACPLGHLLAQHQTFWRQPSTAIIPDVEGGDHRLAGLVGGKFERVLALAEVGGKVFAASLRVPTAHRFHA